MSAVQCNLRFLIITFCSVFFLLSAGWAGTQWLPVGPDGGDARSLAFDPKNPDRIYLGTSAGRLFVSLDSGASWSRFAHLGEGDDYVLDHIAINPADPNVMYVAAWSVENSSGDLFRTLDGGKTWRPLEGVHGKSVRALEIAPSDPKVIVIGALDGVFRSQDGGESWERMSPAGHSDLKNFESVAIDPLDPAKVYAGTWHLPWRTTDGGKTWVHMNKGLIDDSDVFSIIVDPKNPLTVYASACSGIYKSNDAGAQFSKVQGIPFSARRTRVLQQDRTNRDVVYAGTTEGLWKTMDGGKTWKRMTAANVIVNDVMIDPRDSTRVLLATDRSGVLLSRDGASSFMAANRGFAHRQVSAMQIDHTHPNVLYAGLLNDHEFGGVYASRDSGHSWTQMNAGLGTLDVYAVRQSADGTLVAGTNRGIYALSDPLKYANGAWSPRNAYMVEKMAPRPVRSGGKVKMAPAKTWVRSELSARVQDVAVNGNTWFAATSSGLLQSADQGASWKGGPILDQTEFVGVQSKGQTVAAISPRVLVISLDDGINWYGAHVPRFITHLRDVEIDPAGGIWIATREGLWRTADGGENWEHLLAGLPATYTDSIHYETETGRLIAVSRNAVYESADGGRHWQQADQGGWAMRGMSTIAGQRFAYTPYDGILTEAGSTAAGAASPAGAGVSAASLGANH
jgi:photosystem II stability/assembly factor-like uncharacterized protein